MTRPAARSAWLPRLAAGFAGAVGAEMGVALLLYLGGGFLGTLTLLLAVEMTALAAGLWSAPRADAHPLPGVRRAWSVALFSFAAAVGVAAGWEVLGGLAQTWLARGMGLAFLAAMPLYGTGLVLGALATEEDPSGVGRAGTALGAALGFVSVGAGGMSLVVAPFSYVSAVVAISLGALSHTRHVAQKEARWRELADEEASAGVLDPLIPPPSSLPDSLGPLAESPVPPETPR